MFFYKVLVANKYAKKEYIYIFDDLLAIGKVVLVEFGSKKSFAIIIEKSTQLPDCKNIIKIFDYIFAKEFLLFIKKFASFNFISIGSVLELVLPSIAFTGTLNLIYDINGTIYELQELLDLNFSKIQIKKLKIWDSNEYIENKLNLDEDQKQAIEYIKESQKTCLLMGSTGSGKTIVALESVKDLKKKILILVPEINLANNWVKTIKYRFGKVCHVYHSKKKDSYKKHFYNWALSNEAGFIVGTRSALLIPYKNLEKIIIDEEHALSYKQDRYPYYHARDMGILRAFYEKISILLLSATPSMETYYNVCIKKYDCYNLKREPKHGLATIKYVNGSKDQILAPEILEAVLKCFKNNYQVLFFLNRKGYVPYCICNNCKVILSCQFCNYAKTLYKTYQVICHKCLNKQYLPKICSQCKQTTTWTFWKMGVQKLHEYLKNIFVNNTFCVLTCDDKNINESLNQIFENKVNGIVATQILAQGHDFEHIGLVVVVDADMALASTDFRVLEKMYQLWQQIRGRSGRHNIKGEMMIQFFQKENRFIELFKQPDALKFLLNDRKVSNWPPFCKCAFFKFKGKNKQQLEDKLISMNFNYTQNIWGPIYYGMKKNIHEFRFLVKACSYDKLFIILNEISFKYKTVEIEVDPYLF